MNKDLARAYVQSFLMVLVCTMIFVVVCGIVGIEPDRTVEVIRQMWQAYTLAITLFFLVLAIGNYK